VTTTFSRAWLLAAAFLLACSEGPSVGADADRAPCRIAIDVGHGASDPGTRSARGGTEYEFNRRLALDLVDALRSSDACTPSLLDPEGKLIGREGLHARTRLANAEGMDLFLSVHHDSVQPHLLEPWEVEGRKERRSRGVRGYSLFVSKNGPVLEASRRFATVLADELLAAGLRPSLHHAADIDGERRPLLDRERGIYAADFWVIRDSRMPSVLLEAGLITDPEEELRLASERGRETIVDAVVRAVARVRAQPE
jgi:N-acetylmuramoyl-L-alanine amidase